MKEDQGTTGFKTGLLSCLVVVIAQIFLCGCVGPRAYFKDRVMDAGDIVTLTIGGGLGVKARVGPVHFGYLYSNSDYYGCRSGWPEIVELEAVTDTDWTFGAIELNGTGWKRGKCFYAEGGFVESSTPKPWAADLPFFTSLVSGGPPEFHPLFHPFYTQAEVCFGLLGSMRVGVNPGEFLDFLLGWGVIDFFDDDIELKKIRNPKKEVMEGTETSTR